MEKSIFLKKVQEMNLTSEAVKKAKLRNELAQVAKEFNYFYYAKEDCFVPDEGIDVFELMICGTTLDYKESVLKKRTFRIGEDAANQIKDYLTDPDMIERKKNCIAALDDTLNSINQKIICDYTIKKIVPKGKLRTKNIIFIQTENIEGDEAILKFYGEVRFNFQTGFAYFSSYRVSLFDYEKILRDEGSCGVCGWSKKGVPEGI